MNKRHVTYMMLGMVYICTNHAAAPAPTPANPTPTNVMPTTTTTTAATPAPAPAPQPTLNCHYHIENGTHVEDAIILQWAEKATEQSFTLSAQGMNSQLDELKNCYTEQGWTGFYDALQKSGNITAINSRNLSSNAMLDGQPEMIGSKGEQWTVSMPLQVVYQNDKEKLTQNLNVRVVIGRKPSGDLGIMQLIATPKEPAAAPKKSGK